MRSPRPRAATPWAVVSVLTLGIAGCVGGPPELLVITPFEDRADVEIPASAMLERNLDVTPSVDVMQATAEVILQHPVPDDLTVTVTSAAGTLVVLGGRIAEGDDYYRFAVPLLAAQGEPAAGTWKLTIVDAGARGPGTLVVWAVALGGG